MGWGQPHGPLFGTGTTREIDEAQVALRSVGIEAPNLALAAWEAAAEIARLQAEVEELQAEDIVSRNPGIDVDEVRVFRARRAGR